MWTGNVIVHRLTAETYHKHITEYNVTSPTDRFFFGGGGSWLIIFRFEYE